MGGGKINGKEKDAADTILFKAEALRFKDDSDGYRILEGVARRQGGPVPESGQEVPDVPFHITVKGTLPDISVGDEMYSYGRKGTDPKYGQFWQSYGYVKCMPMTVSGIQNYLSHGAIPGINKVRAKKLTAAFGDKTLEVLLKEPERMMSIPGIGKKTYEKIKRSAKEVLGRQSIIQAVMRFIQGVGISPAYAQRICDRYEEKSMDVLQNNPYQLAEDIRGIGFLKADAMP